MNDGIVVLPDAPTELAKVFLRRDLIRNCFALADLAPPYSTYARLPVATEPDGRVLATCLIYTFPGDHSLVAFGSLDGIRAILSSVELPLTTMLVGQDEEWPILADFYESAGPRTSISRLVLARSDFKPVPAKPGFPVEKLDAVCYSEINRLYEQWTKTQRITESFPDATYFGVRNSDRQLCSFAVATACNSGDGIGTLGGMFTDPNFRGRGLASLAMSAACQHWFDIGRRMILVNVSEQNQTPVPIYRSLGFVEKMTYQVMPGRLRHFTSE